MSKIFILGCGPSGLLAAHAAVLEGNDVEVVSIKRKSPMPGTMHLHDAIPDLTPTTPEFTVNYHKVGSADGYALKVYGEARAPVSFRQFDSGERDSWSMRTMYDRLWERYESLIVDMEVDTNKINNLVSRSDLVISSIPAPLLCHNPYHSTRQQKVWLGDTLPEDLELPNNTVIYNGDPCWHWYRASLIDGHPALESARPFAGSYSGIKPLSANCDCLPEVKRVGRFGRWEKGVLVHHAFAQAQQHLADLHVEVSLARGGVLNP